MTHRFIRLFLVAATLLSAVNKLSAQALGLPPNAKSEATPAVTNAAPAAAATNPPDEIVTNTAPVVTRQPSDRTVPQAYSRDASRGAVVLPNPVPDPLERFNRGSWAVNKGALIGVIKPTGKVYRWVVIKPVRTSISHFGHNLLYPGRLLNNLLEGKWKGAKEETDRFLCNTIAGGAGFFDVATMWKMPHSEADFGQTFAQWGWNPNFFLMLPLLGPSNDRDATGLIGDTLDNPLTYFSPYSYITYGIAYNDLTGVVDDYVRFIRSDMDAYADIAYAWGFARQNKVADFQVKGEQDGPSLETLQTVFFTFKDKKFPGRSKTQSVRIPSTGKDLDFTFWLQPHHAPIVYIVPGLGSHRLADAAIALAELAYNKGYSAVTVSSVYNSEFMEHASSVNMPAFTPVDANDLHVALTEINNHLEKEYPGRIGPKALLGYSMGAFESMFIAADEMTNNGPLLKFDRYVAINTPVRLLYGVSKLDEYYRSPLDWPAAEQTTNINNLFLKVAGLSSTSLTPNSSLPFSAIESKFLIGLTFRLILRNVIYSTESRHNQGILQHPLDKWHRTPVYNEIMDYSFKDYFETFVTPYYKSRGIDLSDPHMLEEAGDLRLYSNALKANHKIRLITNRDDFLLPDSDYDWLRATFPAEDLTVFEKGGHLGNLSHPAVQKAIFDALDLPPDAK